MRGLARDCGELRRIARACAIVYTISETHSPAALPSGSASDGRPGELLWRAIFFAVAASLAARELGGAYKLQAITYGL